MVSLVLLSPALKGSHDGRSFLEGLHALNKTLKFHPKSGDLGLGIERDLVKGNLASTTIASKSVPNSLWLMMTRCQMGSL